MKAVRTHFVVWAIITQLFLIFFWAFVHTLFLAVPEVNAQTVLSNDLVVNKTLSGSVYPWATIETIVNYTNNGVIALSGISIIDTYSQYLVFDSVIYSNPDLSISPVNFSHDVALRRLKRDNIGLGAGSSGTIVLRYVVSSNLPPNTDVFNQATIGISCALCQDPYTVANTGNSVGYVNPTPIIPPPPYDFILAASVPPVVYTSGDIIDIALDVSNDTYSSGNVMLEMIYKTFLMEFVGMVNSGGIDFPNANVAHPNLSQNQIRYSYNNGDTSKVRRHGFTVATWWTSHIILRFKMINDYTAPISVDFNLGIPNEYNLISTIGETNSSNNVASVVVQSPEFDLRTNTTILTGDEVSPGIYSTSGNITVRIEFGNSGSARSNIILMNNFDSNQYVSYTGDRDYWSHTTLSNHNWNLFEWPENQWWYRSNISLASGQTGYIDITYQVRQCSTSTNTSRISIIDNYKSALQYTRSQNNNYISTRAREADPVNNISQITMLSDGTCIGGAWRRDDIIGQITSDATGDLTPGQIVTFTVPWEYFSSDPNNYANPIQLSFTFNPWLNFIGILTGTINNDGDTITELVSSKSVEVTKKLILNSFNDSLSQWNEFIGSGGREKFLSGIAHGECKFNTFPTGRPSFDNATLEIFQYQAQTSGFHNQLYIDKFDEYQSLGYGKEAAHLSALIDSQTAIYGYSYLHDSRAALTDRRTLIMECEGQSSYINEIQWWATTGQAETVRQNTIDQYIDYMATHDLRINSHNLCWWGDSNLFSSSDICRIWWDLEQQYYVTGNNLESRVRTTIGKTLSDAYMISLWVSWFQQLLGQRLSPYFDTSKPLVRQYQYRIHNNNYGFGYCPDLSCTQDRNGIQRLYTDLATMEYFADQYLLTTGTNEWLNRSGWYVDLSQIWYSYGNNYSNNAFFIDSFTTTGWLAINNISTLPNTLNTIQLQFLVGEAPVATPIFFDARVWYGYNNMYWSCYGYPGDSNENKWCFYDNNAYYQDTYNSTWGAEGDIVLGEDNNTGIVLTMGSREPYYLTLTKTISPTGNTLPGDIVNVTTEVCNNATGRNDIALSETYQANMVFFWQQTSTLWVPYALNPAAQRIIRNNISLAQNECKHVTTTYTVQMFITSGSQLIFNSSAGSQWAIYTSSGNRISITGNISIPSPIIYSPYGDKEIVSSTFFPGDEIIYRINYTNPGNFTGIMNLYDMYESWLTFSGVISSTQWLTNESHNLTGRIIVWTGVVVEPNSSHNIELSFVISSGKSAFDIIRNNFSYDMTFIPDNSIMDSDNSNNSTGWKASYSFNTFQWYIQHDTNNDWILDALDAPLSWLQVQLIESGVIIANSISDGSGWYLFTGIKPGIYTISYNIPDWYNFSTTIFGSILWWSLSNLGASTIVQYNTYSVNSNGTVHLLKTASNNINWGVWWGSTTAYWGGSIQYDPVVSESLSKVDKQRLLNPSITKSCFAYKDERTIDQWIRVSETFIDAHQLFYSYSLTKRKWTSDYRPFSTITREEAARFFVEFAKNVLCRKPTYVYTSQFSDINEADATLESFIKNSYEYVIFHWDGWSNLTETQTRTFRPKALMTEDELAAVIVRLVTNEYDETTGEDRWSAYKTFLKNYAKTQLRSTRRDNIAEVVYDIYRRNEYILQDVGYVIKQ